MAYSTSTAASATSFFMIKFSYNRAKLSAESKCLSQEETHFNHFIIVGCEFLQTPSQLIIKEGF